MQVYRDIFSYTRQINFSLRMAYKLHASLNECSVSALDLFYVPPTQTSVENGTLVDVHPIASLSDTEPIEFKFERKQEEFLDLAQMLLYVTIRTCEIRCIRIRQWC